LSGNGYRLRLLRLAALTALLEAEGLAEVSGHGSLQRADHRRGEH
jgi:hypothetical protein